MVTVTFDFDSSKSDHAQEAHHRYEYTNNTNSDNEGSRNCMVTWKYIIAEYMNNSYCDILTIRTSTCHSISHKSYVTFTVISLILHVDAGGKLGTVVSFFLAFINVYKIQS